MEKGDLVLVKAVVTAGYMRQTIDFTKDTLQEYLEHPEGAEIVHEAMKDDQTSRNLYRWPCKEPWRGVVVGTSYRATGCYNEGHGPSYDYPDDIDPPYLREDKRHPVIMVQPLYTQRWLKPTPCLEQDLEKVEAS